LAEAFGTWITGGYAYDRRRKTRTWKKRRIFLVKDEQDRVFLDLHGACLFARSIYSGTLLSECLIPWATMNWRIISGKPHGTSRSFAGRPA